MDGNVAMIERIGRKEPKIKIHTNGKKIRFRDSVMEKRNKHPRRRTKRVFPS